MYGSNRNGCVCGRLLAGCLALIIAAPAMADDTELFVSGFDAPASCSVPNVLLIIDTSGSMDTEVETQVSWDPDQSFEGCFDGEALYYSRTGELPDCTSIQKFPKGDNFCAAAEEGLRLVGRYKNLFRGWDANRERWLTLEELTGAPDPEVLASFPVDCEMDRGVHGDGTTGAVFASDGTAQPWALTDASEPAWASASNVTLFDGNWLNWNSNPPSVKKSRLDVVKEVTGTVIDSVGQMNVAIMRFNFNDGGPVLQAMESIEQSREQTKAVINALEPDGQTPLSETLYEAGQYLAGRLVDFGNLGPQVSVAASRLNGDVGSAEYYSPIRTDGQKTYIILLSDGEPNGDTSADAKITALPGFGSLIGPSCTGSGDGACLDDMAEYLFKADLRATVPGRQNVITHTIGFTADLPSLQDTAARGGGRYFRADDTASLTAALTALTESFEEDGGLFTAPAIPVNTFNRAEAFGDVFVSVFESSNTLRWPGNLKKYALDADTTGDNLQLTLVDRNRQPAINPTSGFFADSSQSFWSDEVDGSEAAVGGAASQLSSPADRVLLTNLVGGDLNSPGRENQVEIDNVAITGPLLGAPADERDAVIEWSRGVDVLDENGNGDTTDARRAMGDPLHSPPVSVVYGGTEQAPDITVFVSTNEGYLHAVEADTGAELWAFIPVRLLQSRYALFTNNVSATRLYGLDGEITVTIENSDGQPGISGEERVILLFGMRRGGNAVFALDVTNRSRPQLLWEIDSSSSGFESLGQTWSPPAVTTVRIGADDRRVALFAGGYDTGQDNRTFREDNAGNAVFMVDLLTGERLWSAGQGPEHDLPLPGMRFSIPAALRLFDVNGDGRTDRLYFGDMGAQLWRIDLINGESAGNLAEGGVLATLGAAELGPSPPASEVRRFFATPDVVPIIRDQNIYFSINIGSGYRAHPLDAGTDEQFFAVRDYAVFEVIDTDDYGPALTVDDLVDITNDGSPVLPPDAAGWRLEMVLGVGEKVLNPATTFANTVLFTSFTPANIGNACVPAGGLNRLYAVSVFDGRPQTNFDEPIENGDFEPADRAVELEQGGIAPTPEVLPEFDDAVVVGTEIFEDVLLSPPLSRTFWFQREGP